MGLKETKSIAGTYIVGKIAALAVFLCLQIFYAPITYAAQQPSSTNTSLIKNAIQAAAARPKPKTPISPEETPLFGPGGLLLEPKKLEKFYDVSSEGKSSEETIKELEKKQEEWAKQLAKFGYYEAPSQEELEKKQKELAKAAGLKKSQYAVSSTNSVAAGKQTTSDLLKSRLFSQPEMGAKTVGGLQVNKVDWHAIKQQYNPSVTLKKQKPIVEAALEKERQRAQQKMEEANRNYAQKYRNFEQAEQEVARVRAREEEFRQEKIRAREVAQQAVDKEQELLASVQDLVALYKSQQKEGQDTQDSIERMEKLEKEALVRLEQEKQDLAKAQEIERVVNKKSLGAALAAGIPELESLLIEKKRTQAKLKEAKEIAQESFEAEEQAVKSVEKAESEQRKFEQAPWDMLEGNVLPGKQIPNFEKIWKEIEELAKKGGEKPAPTVAIPKFNPAPGVTNIGEKAGNWWRGTENQAKIEERAEQHLQKLTDLLKYTYTPEQGPNPEVLEAIQKHMKYMDKNKFSVSNTYRTEIEKFKTIASDKGYEKYRAELRNLREAEKLGLQSKASIPPFDPEQRRSDETKEEYAQGYLLGLLGQYHNAANTAEEEKAKTAIKAHAAYMKKQKFVLAKTTEAAQQDERLVRSIKTWKETLLPDWLGWPDPANWRMVKLWKKSWFNRSQNPAAPKVIEAPSTFVPLPVLKAEPGKTSQQNANYYLAELLGHYSGSKALSIPPNPLARSRIRDQLESMEEKGYAVDENLEEQLKFLDQIPKAEKK